MMKKIFTIHGTFFRAWHLSLHQHELPLDPLLSIQGPLFLSGNKLNFVCQASLDAQKLIYSRFLEERGVTSGGASCHDTAQTIPPQGRALLMQF